MKLDKVRFAILIGYISRISGQTFAVPEIAEIDDIIDVEMPPTADYRVNELHQLMALMQEGTKKIDAIKQYRAMTGYGLKESKDAVEKYWPVTRLIADALGTEETGEALVEVARNAHKAEQELASYHFAPGNYNDMVDTDHELDVKG